MKDRFVRSALAYFIVAMLVSATYAFEGKAFISTLSDEKTRDFATNDESILLLPTFSYAEWRKLDTNREWLNVQIRDYKESSTDGNGCENSNRDGVKDCEDSEKEVISISNDENDASIDDALCSIRRPILKSRADRSEGSFVLRTRQRAVVVWNGRCDESGQELLIIESDERAVCDGSDVGISILPLPSMPVEIKRVSNEFSAIRASVVEKIQAITKPGVAVPHDLKSERKKVFSSYCVIIVNAESVATFQDEVEKKLGEIFGDARLSLGDSEKETLKRYIERGLRFFAIDVAEISGNEEIRKAPLAFRFKTDKLYYPLEISSVGRQEFLTLETVVITTGKLVIAQDSDWLIGDGSTTRPLLFTLGELSVNLSIDELKMAPTIADFCTEIGVEEFIARDFIVRGESDEFVGDLVMKNREDKYE